MATWPATLPSPRSEGYQLNPVDPVLRTDMESGAPRSRRRTRARNDQVSVGWQFTAAQMGEFRVWFDDDAGAAGGAAWFAVTLDIGTGAPASVEARFTGIWKGARKPAGGYAVSATLEVR